MYTWKIITFAERARSLFCRMPVNGSGPWFVRMGEPYLCTTTTDLLLLGKQFRAVCREFIAFDSSNEP